MIVYAMTAAFLSVAGVLVAAFLILGVGLVALVHLGPHEIRKLDISPARVVIERGALLLDQSDRPPAKTARTKASLMKSRAIESTEEADDELA